MDYGMYQPEPSDYDEAFRGLRPADVTDAMFEMWHPEGAADSTARGADGDGDGCVQPSEPPVCVVDLEVIE